MGAGVVVQIHEEAQRKAELEAAAVQRERQRAAEEAAQLAAAAQQKATSMHQIQAQQEAEAKKKYAFVLSQSHLFKNHILCTHYKHEICSSILCFVAWSSPPLQLSSAQGKRPCT